MIPFGKKVRPTSVEAAQSPTAAVDKVKKGEALANFER